MQEGPSSNLPTTSLSKLPDINATFKKFEYTRNLFNNILILADWAMNPKVPAIFREAQDDHVIEMLFERLMPILEKIGNIDLLFGSFSEFTEALENKTKEMSENQSEKEKETLSDRRMLSISSKNELQDKVLEIFVTIINEGLKINRTYNIHHALSYLLKNAMMDGGILKSTDLQKHLQLQCAREIFENSLEMVLGKLTKLPKEELKEVAQLNEIDAEIIRKGFLAFLGQLTKIDPLAAQCFHNFVRLLKKVPNSDTVEFAVVVAAPFCGAFQLNYYLPHSTPEGRKTREAYRIAFKVVICAILNIPDLFEEVYNPALYLDQSQDSFDSTLPFYLCQDLLISSDSLLNLRLKCSLEILEKEMSQIDSDYAEKFDFEVQGAFTSFMGQLAIINSQRAKIIHNALSAFKQDPENIVFPRMFANALQAQNAHFQVENKDALFLSMVHSLIKLNIFSKSFNLVFYEKASQPAFNALFIMNRKHQCPGDPSWKKGEEQTRLWKRMQYLRITPGPCDSKDFSKKSEKEKSSDPRKRSETAPAPKATSSSGKVPLIQWAKTHALTARVGDTATDSVELYADRFPVGENALSPRGRGHVDKDKDVIHRGKPSKKNSNG